MDLRGWNRWAVDVRSYLVQFSNNLNVPGPIARATATANELNVQLEWTPAKGAAFYWIYKGMSGDFQEATLIRQVAASKTRVATYRYLDSQDLTGTQYYWIVPLNERLQEGPRSAMMTVSTFDTSGASKTLTNNTTTNLFSIGALPQTAGDSVGGIIQYSVTAYNGDIQIETGIVGYNYAQNNIALPPIGTIGAIGLPLQSLTGGTIVVTWGGPTNAAHPVFTVKVNSSLAIASTLNYTINNLSNQWITLL